MIKMKLLCIIISLALVNVLVAELDGYIKQVLITNDHIKLAKKKMSLILATPESDGEHITPLERLEYQTTMQLVISAETGFDVPTFHEEKLTSLLEERRCHTSKGLKNKIIHASGHLNENYLAFLGSERRYITLEAVKYLIQENDPFFSDLDKMCRLIGVFRSIKHPLSYVDSAGSDDNGNCFIIDVNYDTKIYTFLNGELWEVERNFAPIRPFSKELQDQ